MHPRVCGALLAAALILTGCSSETKPGATTSPAKKPITSPVTGLPLKALPDRPAFLVKVENTANGEPQYGVGQADLVVEELVEGGLTRLAAVYYTHLPAKVGHVRSARTTDIGLAAPLDATVVASGAASFTYKMMRRAHVTMLTQDHGARGFSSDPAKHAPYNRLLDLPRLAEGVKAPDAVNPYFQWSSKSALAGKLVREVTVRYSGVSATKFVLRQGAWRRLAERSAPGEAFAASNLVVIFARFGDAGYRDPAGNAVPEATIAGSGTGLVVVGGTAVAVTWRKSDIRSPMTFTDAKGKPVKLRPGTTWVSLAPTGGGSVSTG
jgi:hypothetical protein